MRLVESSMKIADRNYAYEERHDHEVV